MTEHITERNLEEICHRAQLAIHQHDHDRFYDDLVDVVGDMVDLMVELRKVWEEQRRGREGRAPGDHLDPHQRLRALERFLDERGMLDEAIRWLAESREASGRRAEGETRVERE